jgi:hypothetical protein
MPPAALALRPLRPLMRHSRGTPPTLSTARSPFRARVHVSPISA